jgi:tetratricopeptide (TPR) repeat protein
MKINVFAGCLLTVMLVGCASPSSKINAVHVGMTSADVIKVMGQPNSTSAQVGIEYMIYQLSDGTKLGIANGHLWSDQRMNSYYVRIKNNVVDSYGRVGDFDSTNIPETKQTIDLTLQEPGNADAYNNRGYSKQIKGDFDGAIADYSKAIELKPDFALAYINRGNSKQFKGDVDGAIADYSATIDLRTDYAEAYNCRGYAKQTKGDLDGAIADHSKAIELKPDFALAYINRGNAKHLKGDLDGAITDCTKAIKLKPDFADAYVTRAAAKAAKTDWDGAIEDYTKALELKPDYAEAYNSRGYAKQIKGDLDGAIADHSKAIELKPDFALAYISRAYAKQIKGDFDGGIADCSEAMQLKLDHVNLAAAYITRGSTKSAKGDLDGAMADYTEAIELKPDLADSYIYRGCVRYDAQDFTDALLDFRKAVQLGSSNEYARFWVWLTRARQGETEAATTELQTYLADSANSKVNDWPTKIGLFLAGQLAEPEFLAAANNTDQNKGRGQLCEAYFYAGSKHLFAGDKPVAEDYFRKSIATNHKAYLEYASAVAELKSLKKQN